MGHSGNVSKASFLAIDERGMTPLSVSRVVFPSTAPVMMMGGRRSEIVVCFPARRRAGDTCD